MSKIIFVTIAMLLVISEKIMAKSLIMDSSTNTTALQTVDDRISLSEKADINASQSFQDVSNRYNAVNHFNQHAAWGGMHTAGLIMVCAGPPSILIGGVCALVGAATHGDHEVLIGFGAGLAVVGLVATVVGIPLLIKGAVHDRRYGLIAPKGNEIGIAYNF